MKTLFKIKELGKSFPLHRGLTSRNTTTLVHAVKNVSVDIFEGEILGLVGESGCGKTTLGRLTLRLIEPTQGQAFFMGEDIFQLKPLALEKLRPKMQIIFQDPFSSLNPRFTVERIVGEAMLIHGYATKANLKDKVGALLEQVGLPRAYASRYAHEFSGGQRQRIGIARAIALKPRYIVCDEPVSALDVSIQAQIINLLKSLQAENNLTLLFISHDLNVVSHLSQRTAVMYLGEIVELAPTEKLHSKGAHPYTQLLLSAKPTLNPKLKGKELPGKGEPPSPLAPPTGCHFHPRCPEAMDHCKTKAARVKRN